MFEGPFSYSIVKRAQEKGLVEMKIHNLRDWSTDKYKSVDDHPYGGGAGMVMRIDIINSALKKLRTDKSKVILMDAGGEKFTQKKAQALSLEEHLIIICGHYEGVDHRVHEHLVDEIISVGDYVLSGGELPAMTIADSLTRLIPGALGNNLSVIEESHTDGGAEYPQYTRPEEFNDWKVPEILLSGDHKKIDAWRKSKR